MTRPIIQTPRGMIMVMPNGKAELKFYTKKFVGGSGGGSGRTGFMGAQSWQEKFSDAQWFVDNEVLRLSEPFTPLLAGMLVKSSILGTELGSGEVKWIAPYSRKRYYTPRKSPSTTGPLRGPFWFENMKSAFGRGILAGAKVITGGK